VHTLVVYRSYQVIQTNLWVSLNPFSGHFSPRIIALFSIGAFVGESSNFISGGNGTQAI
jgi:hypothetical protein